MSKDAKQVEDLTTNPVEVNVMVMDAGAYVLRYDFEA